MTGRRAHLMIAAAIVLLAASLTAASAAPRSGGGRPGAPDRSFGGGDGVAYSDLPPAYDFGIFNDLVEAPDGKLVDSVEEGLVVVESGSFEEAAIQRRLRDGSLDPSFGSGGSVSLKAPPESLAVDSAGRVLYVEGQAIRRLNPDGSVDAGFRPPKAIYPNFGPKQLAFAPDGDIVVAGLYQVPGPKDLPGESGIVIARLAADGSLDPSFGKAGVVAFRSLPSSLGSTFDDLAELADGSLLLLAEKRVFRYRPDGTPDPGFGKDGSSELPNSFQPDSLIATSDGEPLVAGCTQTGRSSDDDCQVLAYRPDGSPDDSFGDNGATTIDAAPVDLFAAPDGGSVVVGVSEDARPPDAPKPLPVAIRLDASGHPVPGFGEAGVLAMPSTAPPAGLDDSYERVTSAVVGPSGRILIAGSNEDPLIRARTADGALEPSFGGGASQVTQVKTNKGVTLAKGLVADPSGKLFVAANSNSARRSPASVLIGFSADGRQTSLGPKLGFAQLEVPGAILADGKGLVSLSRPPRPQYLGRVDLTGAPDRGFGEDGKVLLPDRISARTVLVGKGGALFVLGHSPGKGMAAARYTSAGRPVRSFGKQGLAYVGFPHGSATALAGVALPDGDLILAGSAGTHVRLARLRPGGRLDRSFGDRGRSVIRLRGRVSDLQLVRLGDDLAISGRLLSKLGDRSAFAMRLNADGRPQKSFGRGSSLDASGIESPVAILPSRHRIVLVGARAHGGVVLRAFHRMNGRLDRSFGAGGTVRAAVRQGRFRFHPVVAVRDAGGSIVIAGTSGNDYEPGSRVELLRFHG